MIQVLRAAVAASLFALPAAALAQTAPIAGEWAGQLGGRLPLVAHIQTDGTASLDSPSQGARGLPMTVTLKGLSVRLVLETPAAVFEGKVALDGQSMTGDWQQGGGAAPLTFNKTSDTPAPPVVLKRPQTPKPPFPYKAEEVSYLNPASGLKLAGTLTLPEGKGPFPAALLITGSGTQDRDETILGHKPFLVLADALTRRGVAVLRVDDRGAGGSQIGAVGPTLDEIATDVAAGLAWLRQRPDIAGDHIGLIGHSEGAMVAPLVAATDPKLAFVVLMAGAGVDGRSLMMSQARALVSAAGAPPDRVAKRLAVEAQLLTIVASDADAATALEQMNAVAGPSPQFKTMLTPAYRSLIRFDPRPAMGKITCPVLALGGDRDLQVPAAENLPAIKAALTASRDVSTDLLPGLNHLFQTARTGLPNEYGQIEETLAPAALERITSWVAAHAQ